MRRPPVSHGRMKRKNQKIFKKGKTRKVNSNTFRITVRAAVGVAVTPRTYMAPPITKRSLVDGSKVEIALIHPDFRCGVAAVPDGIRWPFSIDRRRSMNPTYSKIGGAFITCYWLSRHNIRALGTLHAQRLRLDGCGCPHLSAVLHQPIMHSDNSSGSGPEPTNVGTPLSWLF